MSNDMNESEKLHFEPCPFCGADVAGNYADDSDPELDGRDHHLTKDFIVCGNCGAQGPKVRGVDESRIAWNKRAK